MAIYIQLRKLSETPSLVIYEFGPSEGLIGSVSVDKSSGTVLLLNIAGGREDFYLPRITRVLQRHFESGEFPDETCYAA